MDRSAICGGRGVLCEANRRLSPFACTFGLLLFGTDIAASGHTSAPSPAWPHSMTINGANVTVYEPQAIDWPDHETLTSREAIAITRPGETTPVLGTTEISFSTQTDTATGNAILSNTKPLTPHFPALDTA